MPWVTQLRAAHITVDVDGKSYPNGRFARLHDPEGQSDRALGAKALDPAAPLISNRRYSRKKSTK